MLCLCICMCLDVDLRVMVCVSVSVDVYLCLAVSVSLYLHMYFCGYGGCLRKQSRNREVEKEGKRGRVFVGGCMREILQLRPGAEEEW